MVQVENNPYREQPIYRELKSGKIEPEDLIDEAAEYFNVKREKFSVKHGDGTKRGIVSELLYKYSGLKQKEIGKIIGDIDYSAVSKLRMRLKKSMESDEKIKH